MPLWIQLPLGILSILYFAVVIIGNCFVYGERNKDWHRLSDKDTYGAFKWIYFWPFLLMYWIPKLLWTMFVPWVWGGVRKFFGNYGVAYRVYRTGK